LEIQGAPYSPKSPGRVEGKDTIFDLPTQGDTDAEKGVSTSTPMIADQPLPTSSTPAQEEPVPMDTGGQVGKRGGDFPMGDAAPVGKKGRVCSTFLAPIGPIDFDVNEDEDENPTTSDYNFSFKSQDGDFGEEELRDGRMRELQAMAD
jgi:hypothetical protein